MVLLFCYAVSVFRDFIWDHCVVFFFSNVLFVRTALRDHWLAYLLASMITSRNLIRFLLLMTVSFVIFSWGLFLYFFAFGAVAIRSDAVGMFGFLLRFVLVGGGALDGHLAEDGGGAALAAFFAHFCIVSELLLKKSMPFINFIIICVDH